MHTLPCMSASRSHRTAIARARRSRQANQPDVQRKAAEERNEHAPLRCRAVGAQGATRRWNRGHPPNGCAAGGPLVGPPTLSLIVYRQFLVTAQRFLWRISKRNSGKYPSSGPRRLVRGPVAVHLLPREKVQNMCAPTRTKDEPPQGQALFRHGLSFALHILDIVASRTRFPPVEDLLGRDEACRAKDPQGQFERSGS